MGSSLTVATAIFMFFDGRYFSVFPSPVVSTR